MNVETSRPVGKPDQQKYDNINELDNFVSISPKPGCRHTRSEAFGPGNRQAHDVNDVD